MEIIEKTFALRSTPIFCNSELDYLLSLADQLEHLYFKKGEDIFKKGSTNTNTYLLTSGSVNCIGNDWSTLLHPPYLFGEEEAFNNLPRHYTAHCRKATSCLVIHQETLYQAIMNSPDIGINFLERHLKSNPSPHLQNQDLIQK